MCKVTMGHLRVTVGHPRVTIGHLRLTIGYLKATVVRVTLGHFKVTIGYSISKHKANITELHPKVRQTCLYCICLNFILVPSLGEEVKIISGKVVSYEHE